jgi:anthranilate synthase component I
VFTRSLQPALAEVMRAPEDAIVPVHRSVSADTETPISVFLKLRRGATAFLLESAEQDGSLGRFSFIGAAPDAVLRAGLERGTITTEQGITAYDGAPLTALRRFVGAVRPLPCGDGLPAFVGGAVGALGYDFVRSLERLPSDTPDDTGFPAAIFGRYDTVVVFDHLKQRLTVVSLVRPGRPREDGYRLATARVEQTLMALRRAPAVPAFDGMSAGGAASRLADVAREPDDAAFREAVVRAREYIHAGDAIQVVLSRRMRVPLPGDPFRLYRALRMLNPSPYMFFLEFPELAIAGASPEMLLRVGDDAAQVCPIAGTRPRGADADEDAQLEAELLADPKERAEHVMLVDLARNDLGRICAAGSVHVPRFMQVERFSHVMHLVSTATGRLAPGVDALDALAACFPAGTLSGAPKIRAAQIIDELEPARRGLYGGAVGYVGYGARSLDTCIAIRTAVIRNGVALLQTGAGIVADSLPERELAETDAKAQALLAALAAAGAARPAPRLEEVTA